MVVRETLGVVVLLGVLAEVLVFVFLPEQNRTPSYDRHNITCAELQTRLDKAVPPAQTNPYGDLSGATRAIALDFWSCVPKQTCWGV